MPPRAAAAALLLALLASFLPPALPQPAAASDASSRVDSRGPLELVGGAQCNPEDEFEGATHIFNGWMERAAACLRSIETGTCNSMGHGMAYLTAARKLCAYKYSYTNGVFSYDAPKGNAACEHAVLQRRAVALLVVLNHLAQHPPSPLVALPNTRNFSFYYFTRDAVPTDNPLRCYLGLPALVAGLSHSDRCSLPLPHPHLLLAMAAHYGVADRLPSSIAFDDRSTALLAKYRQGQGHSNRHLSWAERLPKLVYRGGCKLTHDPDDPGLRKWVQARSQLCNINRTAGIAARHIDVGISLVTAAKWMQACRACQAGGISQDRWMPARYQLVAEGVGPSCDATDIKFISGGVVIWPTFSGYRDHLYYMWYQPLLKPGYNYFRPTIEEVGPLVVSCERHLQEQCSEVARRSHQMYTCAITFDSAGMYLLKLMQALSQWRR